MRSLKAPLKDYLRRRALARSGIRPELDRPLFHAGSRSATWVLDPAPLGRDSVVYSVGVGNNIDWDLALVERFSLELHAFDPTPRSAAWLATQAVPAGFTFHRTGLGTRNGLQSFEEPRNERSLNFRPLTETDPRERSVQELPVERLRTIAARLGHARVDVLKLDVEGGEYELLPDLLASDVPIGQLLIEFHHGRHGRVFADTERAIASLRAAGYRVLHVSRRGLELSFLHPDLT